MSDTVIKVENLSKKYILSHQSQEKYTALRDVMANGVRNLGKKLLSPFTLHSSQDSLAASEEEFFALRDVSFEIKQGDRVGIIGRNGAGKSTLLKILSRITEPTSGKIEITGRVASLLEVGTGFHPELTGRENIFLNGAILGMGKAEIKRKFDEIVAFAEVERFLDTPVKRYSSGMYVRLAFAVAAHLEPEILIVDEVLAVGDTQFQKKCLGKMEEAGREGRTVLFVSHNMTAIQSLCERGILLDKGRVYLDACINDIVAQYMDTVISFSRKSISDREDRQGNQKLKFTDFELRNSKGRIIQSVGVGETVDIVLHYQSSSASELRNVHFAISVHGRLDENLFHLSTSYTDSDFECLPSSGKVICRLSKLPLQPGLYNINIFSRVGGDIADWIQKAALIEIEARDFFGTGKFPPPDQGPFIMDQAWRKC